MIELITTGTNVEQAVAEACERLGLSPDEVSVEVLEMPQKKLFGMSPAKVRVTAQEKTEPEYTEPEKNESGPRQPFKAEDEENESPAELSGSALEAFNYFKTVSAKLGAEKIQFEAVVTESFLKFKADGEDAALLIGRRGDTMEALQYLCSLVYNRGEREFGRLIVDVSNYRSKRERSLQQLAKNTAAKVIRTKRPQTLEAMNPYERRIVHSAVQQISGVKSESTGEEPRRRVIILPEGGYKNRSGGRHRNGERNHRDQQRHDSSPKSETPKVSEVTPKTEKVSTVKPADNSYPLYGKIEL